MQYLSTRKTLRLMASSLVAGALTLPLLASAQNLLNNGSFETADCATRVAGVGTTCTGNVSTGQWAVFKTLPGWTTVSGAGIEVRDNFAGTAKDGTNFVELDSHGVPGSNNSFMQQVFTSTNAQMQLSFWYAARAGTAANTNGIEVWWNGQNVSSRLTPNPANGSTNTSWIQYTLALTGNVGSNTIGFKAVGIDDTFGGSLDQVAITAVPEAGTLGMMLAGLGAVGFVARRRRPK
jgi:hypothetical protein